MSTIQNLYNDLKTLCKQWFYEKSEVNDALANKQNNLVSGTNIKTINNQSLLGDGNISIQAGDSVALACVSDHYFDSTTKEIVLDACAGKVISDVSKSTSGLVDTYTITFNDNSTYVFTVTNGSDGNNGKGISSISKTSTSGKVDTYTITYTDNTTSTFTVTNGNDGSSPDIVTSTNGWNSTTSDSKVPSEKLTKASLDNKLDKVLGTANRFVVTDSSKNVTLKEKLGNITLDGKVGSNANYFLYTTTSGEVTSKQKIGNITTSGAIGSTSGLPIVTTTSGVLTTGAFGTGSGQFAEGNHTHSSYVNPTIADNLTTNDATQVLSAKQGKVLNDMIGSAITYIVGSGS